MIYAIKSLLKALLRRGINAVNVKLKKPKQLELKGINETKVILKLMVPMDQLNPQAQEVIRLMRVK
jgi:hypothetical protein